MKSPFSSGGDKVERVESEVELEKIKNEVYRKVGRNLLRFQVMEQKLKTLLAVNGFSGEDSLEQRRAPLLKSTMGDLIGKFHDTYFVGKNVNFKRDTEEREPSVSFSCRVEGNSDFSENKKKSLKFLVEGRNELVHHFHERLGMDKESWKNADQFLDEQNVRLLSEISNLENLFLAIRESLKKYQLELLGLDS